MAWVKVKCAAGCGCFTRKFKDSKGAKPVWYCSGTCNKGRCRPGIPVCL